MKEKSLGRRLRSGHRGEMRAESTGPGGLGPRQGGWGQLRQGRMEQAPRLVQVGCPCHRWVSLGTMTVTGGCCWVTLTVTNGVSWGTNDCHRQGPGGPGVLGGGAMQRRCHLPPFFLSLDHVPSGISESFCPFGTRSGPGGWPTAPLRTDAS